jgi:hypothetical protein
MLRALTSEPTKTMKGMQLKTKIVTNNILPYREQLKISSNCTTFEGGRKGERPCWVEVCQVAS